MIIATFVIMVAHSLVVIAVVMVIAALVNDKVVMSGCGDSVCQVPPKATHLRHRYLPANHDAR